MFDSFLKALGVVSLAFTLHHIIYFIWFYWFRQRSHWSTYKGDWAVVVGASKGLGRALSLGLARRGLNVILLAKTQSALEKVASEIRELKQEAIAIVADVTSPTLAQQLQQIQELSNSHVITVLVNNSGGPIGITSTRKFSEFLEYSEAIIEQTHQFNTGYVEKFIRVLLPQMLARKKGTILNIGSLSSENSMYLIPYSSEKSRLNSLTQSLALEVEDSGVTVQCAVCGAIVTDSSGSYTNAGWFTPTAEVISRDIINSVGCGFPIVIPFWAHQLQYLFALSLPWSFRKEFLKSIYKNLKRKNK